MEGGKMMHPIQLIIGNLCSLLAVFTDSISATRKTTRGVLLVQSVSQIIYGIGSVVLGGYSGAVQNVMSVLRNFVAIKKIDSKALKWVMVILGVVLGALFNNLGIWGWLPILANLEYTLAVFYFKDNQRALKIAFLISVVLFAVFNGIILSIVGVVTNMIVLITGIIALVREKKE
jgi:hypothetical protein